MKEKTKKTPPREAENFKKKEHKRQKVGQRKYKEGKATCGRRKCRTESSMSFTEQEIKFLETKLENGYDLKSDECYNAWLKTKDGGQWVMGL